VARRVQSLAGMAHRSSLTAGGPPAIVFIAVLAALVALGVLIGNVVGGGRRPSDSGTASPAVPASPAAVVVGEATGSAWPAETAVPTASPTPEPSATPAPTDEASGGGFVADVVVCRSVHGSHCNGRFETLPDDASSFWLLVHFQNSRRGDEIATQLDGPGGTIDTPDFTVKGGDGYAWAQVSARRLASGSYTLSVARNGRPAAETTFRVP
jgi:hypothetical protein